MLYKFKLYQINYKLMHSHCGILRTLCKFKTFPLKILKNKQWLSHGILKMS